MEFVDDLIYFGLSVLLIGNMMIIVGYRLSRRNYNKYIKI